MIKIPDIMRSLRGLIPEWCRQLVIDRFVDAVFRDAHPDHLDEYVDHIIPRFRKNCGEPLPNGLVAHFKGGISADALTDFCSRWMAVQSFRVEGEEEWQPFTPDMHNVRVTMIRELRELAGEEA